MILREIFTIGKNKIEYYPRPYAKIGINSLKGLT